MAVITAFGGGAQAAIAANQAYYSSITNPSYFQSSATVKPQDPKVSTVRPIATQFQVIQKIPTDSAGKSTGYIPFTPSYKGDIKLISQTLADQTRERQADLQQTQRVNQIREQNFGQSSFGYGPVVKAEYKFDVYNNVGKKINTEVFQDHPIREGTQIYSVPIGEFGKPSRLDYPSEFGKLQILPAPIPPQFTFGNTFDAQGKIVYRDDQKLSKEQIQQRLDQVPVEFRPTTFVKQYEPSKGFLEQKVQTFPAQNIPFAGFGTNEQTKPDNKIAENILEVNAPIIPIGDGGRTYKQGEIPIGISSEKEIKQISKNVDKLAELRKSRGYTLGLYETYPTGGKKMTQGIKDEFKGDAYSIYNLGAFATGKPTKEIPETLSTKFLDDMARIGESAVNPNTRVFDELSKGLPATTDYIIKNPEKTVGNVLAIGTAFAIPYGAVTKVPKILAPAISKVVTKFGNWNYARLGEPILKSSNPIERQVKNAQRQARFDTKKYLEYEKSIPKNKAIYEDLKASDIRSEKIKELTKVQEMAAKEGYEPNISYKDKRRAEQLNIPKGIIPTEELPKTFGTSKVPDYFKPFSEFAKESKGSKKSTLIEPDFSDTYFGVGAKTTTGKRQQLVQLINSPTNNKKNFGRQRYDFDDPILANQKGITIKVPRLPNLKYGITAGGALATGIALTSISKQDNDIIDLTGDRFLNRQKGRDKQQPATILDVFTEQKTGQKEKQRYSQLSSEVPFFSQPSTEVPATAPIQLPRYQQIEAPRFAFGEPKFPKLFTWFGGGVSGPVRDADRMARVFKVFDVAKVPAGRTKVGLGYLEVSPIPNYEIQKTRKNKDNYFDVDFFEINKQNKRRNYR